MSYSLFTIDSSRIVIRQICVVSCGLLLMLWSVNFVNAQEVEKTKDADTSIVEDQVIPTLTSETPVLKPDTNSDGNSEDAKIDNMVTNEELGTTKARILPNSALYGFKRFERALRETLTFNPIKKAELRLANANQELSDAQQLVDANPDSGDAISAASRAVVRYEQRIEKIKDTIDGINAQKQDNREEVSALLDNVLDKQIKHRKVLEHLEGVVLQNAPQDVRARVADTIAESRDRATQHTGEIMGAVDTDANALTSRIDRVLQQQTGSDFKDLRNLEALRHVEQFVPSEARDAILNAQTNAFKRLSSTINSMPEDARGKRFEQYARNVSGDETMRMELFDRMKQGGELPEDIQVKMEKMKDITATRFKQRMDGIDSQFDEATKTRFRDRALQRLQNDNLDVGQMRVIQDIRERVEFENPEMQKEMRKTEEESVKKFTTAFSDVASQGQAERFMRLSKQMAENPDPTTFRLLQSLEKEVKSDPKKRVFLESMERGAKTQFAERVASEGDGFLERIATTNPRDFEVFDQLRRDFQQNPEQFSRPEFGERKEGFDPGPVGGSDVERAGLIPVPEGFDPGPVGVSELKRAGLIPVPEGVQKGSAGGSRNMSGPPPGFERFFDRAKQVSSERITQEVKGITDPALFASFEQRFKGVDPKVFEEIKQRQSSFQGALNQKRDFVKEQQLQQEENQTRSQFEQLRKSLDQEFDQRLTQVTSPEERLKIEGERGERERSFNEKATEARTQSFEKRIQNDPFCDSACKQFESNRFKQEVDTNRKELELNRELQRTRADERKLFDDKVEQGRQQERDSAQQQFREFNSQVQPNEQRGQLKQEDFPKTKDDFERLQKNNIPDVRNLPNSPQVQKNDFRPPELLGKPILEKLQKPQDGFERNEGTIQRKEPQNDQRQNEGVFKPQPLLNDQQRSDVRDQPAKNQPIERLDKPPFDVRNSKEGGEQRPNEQSFKSPQKPEEVFDMINKRVSEGGSGQQFIPQQGQQIQDQNKTTTFPPQGQQNFDQNRTNNNQQQNFDGGRGSGQNNFTAPQPSQQQFQQQPSQQQFIAPPVQAERREQQFQQPPQQQIQLPQQITSPNSGSFAPAPSNIGPQASVNRYLAQLFGSIFIKSVLAGW